MRKMCKNKDNKKWVRLGLSGLDTETILTDLEV